jgi:aconitate hydratase
VARSFARIHRRNLIAQGIIPLVFTADADLGDARQGDTWEIPGVRRALEEGSEEFVVRVQGGDARLSVLGRFSSREREVLLGGGLIAWLRSGGLVPMSVHRGESALVDQGSPVTNPIGQDEVDGR